MGFEDLLGQGNKQDKQGKNSPYGYDDYNQTSRLRSENNDIKQMLLN
jgi:hypothetical protein